MHAHSEQSRGSGVLAAICVLKMVRRADHAIRRAQREREGQCAIDGGLVTEWALNVRYVAAAVVD